MRCEDTGCETALCILYILRHSIPIPSCHLDLAFQMLRTTPSFRLGPNDPEGLLYSGREWRVSSLRLRLKPQTPWRATVASSEKQFRQLTFKPFSLWRGPRGSLMQYPRQCGRGDWATDLGEDVQTRSRHIDRDRPARLGTTDAGYRTTSLMSSR
jgi:hypothetical protein